MHLSNARPSHRGSLRKRKASPTVSEEFAVAKVPRAREESSNDKPTTNINYLPDEFLGRVIRVLEPKDRVSSESVCRKWSRVSRAHSWLNFRLIANEQWSYRWKNANWRRRRDRLDGRLAGVVERERSRDRPQRATCAGNLKELRMEHVALDGWTNGHLDRLFAGMENLEELHFRELNFRESPDNGRDGGEEFEEEDVATRLECLGALKKLRRLVLRCNGRVTSKVLERIVEGCLELESVELVFFGNGDVTKEAIGRLAQLPELNRLRLYHHPSIDDETLAELARGPAQLRELEIFHCDKVTDRGIDYLLEGCGGQLRKLNVTNCLLVTRETWRKLEALYNDSSSSWIKEGRFFVLKLEGIDGGDVSAEFEASRRVT